MKELRLSMDHHARSRVKGKVKVMVVMRWDFMRKLRLGHGDAP